MKKIPGTILLLCCFVQLTAQEISIRFDFTQARTTLSLLGQDALHADELASFLKLPATQALLRKVGSPADSLTLALQKTISGQKQTPAALFKFQYAGIYQDLPGLTRFVNALETTKDSMEHYLIAKFKPYLKPQQQLEVTVYGLMGSFSGGWTEANDPHHFYLGLHFKPYDVAGTLLTCEHELFHNIQALNYQGADQVYERFNSLKPGMGAAYYLLYFLYREGSAEFVADQERASANSASVLKSYEHFAVNKSRLQECFYLTERSLLDWSHRDSLDEAEFQRSYSILFDWNWNNPGYFVGYEMMKALVAANGEAYLKQSLGRDPLYFLADYIALGRKGRKLPYQFSAELENWLSGAIRKMEEKPTGQ